MSQVLRARSDANAANEEPVTLAGRESAFSFALSRPTVRVRSFLVLFIMWIVLRNTWLCEDAFITYRVVDNFVHGLGLRWNPLERVQTYTHPLWMFCVSAVYFVTRDIYLAPTYLSLVCTASAVGLLVFRGLKSLPQCLLAVAILGCSKAFIDYSTSGLENPLSNLLLALFVVEQLKGDEDRSFGKQVWYAGLAITNRMDLACLLLPAIAHRAWTDGALRRRGVSAWAGLSPFVAWEIFSLLYYGFPFPNSAYAKLGTGVRPHSVLLQGQGYLLNSLSWDPITLFAIAGLVGTALFVLRDRAIVTLALGVLFYVAYVIAIGGDYMSGRFFAAPLFASLFVLSRVDFDHMVEVVIMLLVVIALGLSSPRPPIQTNDQYIGLGSSPQGVDDERGYRHNDTSLLKLNREQSLKGLGGWVADGVRANLEHTPVSIYRNIGYYGFFAGPGVHVIDPYGIGDPLMSRMPFPEDAHWSPGHFLRNVPEGYVEAAIGQGDFSDPRLAAYWAKLKLVTRGPIFDRKRLKEVLRFNLGMNPAPRPAE